MNCVTVPVDARLPLSGQQLCGLYDINPAAFGQVDNLVTRNKDYGKQEEIYNGADVNFQLRLAGRATLGGGWNIGNAVQLGTTAGGSASAGTDTCYVIDSPQQLFNCKIDVPYQNRVKINGSFTVPYGIQVAAVAQSNPGANYSANRTFTLAEIQPTLGRPLSGGLTTVVIPLVTPLSTSCFSARAPTPTSNTSYPGPRWASRRAPGYRCVNARRRSSSTGRK